MHDPGVSEELPARACARCGGPVVRNRDRYDAFERMHWACFHYEHEHGSGERDVACADPSCPARAFDPDPQPARADAPPPRRRRPSTTGVPNVTEIRPRDALAALRGAGLQPVVLGVPSLATDGDVGYVVAAQEPVAGTLVGVGARVLLALDVQRLSLGGLWGIDGPPRAQPGSLAPELVGVELEAALIRAANAGFVSLVLRPSRAVEALAISRQEPAAGDPVESGQILLWLD
jgi:hypothetical protein